MAALHRVCTDKPVFVYQVIPPDNAFQVFDLGFVLKVTATICYFTLLSDIVRLNQSVAPFLALLDIPSGQSWLKRRHNDVRKRRQKPVGYWLKMEVF